MPYGIKSNVNSTFKKSIFRMAVDRDFSRTPIVFVTVNSCFKTSRYIRVKKFKYLHNKNIIGNITKKIVP